jgi:hypothetical protein
MPIYYNPDYVTPEATAAVKPTVIQEQANKSWFNAIYGTLATVIILSPIGYLYDRPKHQTYRKILAQC